MKFARYLEDNLTPEWRRAYIDYKGCKKRIKVVSQRLANRSDPTLSSAPTPGRGGGGGGGGAERDGEGEGRGCDGVSRGVGLSGVDGQGGRDGTGNGNTAAAGDNIAHEGSVRDARGAEASTSTSPPGANKPLRSGSLSVRHKNRWRAAIGADEDSSDDDVDNGPSAPPRSATRGTPSLRGSRGTPSVRAAEVQGQAISGGGGGFGAGRGSSKGTPRTPQATTRPATATPNYGSTRLSPRPPGAAPTNPPPLDLGEPSVDQSAPTPTTRTRGNTVAFASSPESEPGHDLSVLVQGRILESERHTHTGPSPPQSGDGSHDSHVDRGASSDSAPNTPLTRPIGMEKDRADTGTDNAVGLKSPQMQPLPPTSSTPRSPRSPMNAFQNLVRKVSLSASPRYQPHSPPGPASASPMNVPPGSPRSGGRSLRSMTLPSPYLPARTASTFEELYDSLAPDEQAFFDFLDKELQKVESFYLARQADALRRGEELRAQLRELAEHRRVYHDLYGPGGQGLAGWEGRVERIIPTRLGTEAAYATVTGVANAAQKLHLRLPGRGGEEDSNASGSGNGASRSGSDAKGKGSDDNDVSPNDHGAIGEPRETSDKSHDLREAMRVDKEHRTYSPERYTKYKHELKKAVLEYYRQLEIIKNYRIMNVTGFRKALKKFEKASRIHCLELYTDDRISSEAFAKGETIEGLLKTAEDMFSTHFEHGDLKKARDRLRHQDSGHTHYTSVFRSGLLLGIGLPIAIVAIVEAIKESTAERIPAWEGLLQVYGGLFLPVIFALLFELNLAAYVANRINYEFVMELSRPALDFRSYMEIPSFLFFTLSVCMYFSYFRIGAHNVAPTTWPAAWLVFVAVFFLNPLPIFRRHSRYWFLRVLWRVITPGWSRVEFIAFFIADELNSLAYSVANILFLSCAYANKWPDDIYAVCPSGSRWYYIFMFAAPAAIRLIQCLKRWRDSGLRIHLINAGKYCSAILQYGFFIWWRSRGSNIPDNVFIGWVIVAIISSSYNTAWDYVVDWALFRSGSQGLRKDRGYASKHFYYFAMITNLLIRFVWVWYIPARASNVRLRGFFFALAEVLRRWQWNFFRVETEHLGNADAYRVTREVPLPYRRIDPDSDEEAERAKLNPVKARWSRVMRHLTDGGSGHEGQGRGGGRGGPGTFNFGPMGFSNAREYEARRPGDRDEHGEARSGDEETNAAGLPNEGGKDRGWDGLIRRIKARSRDQAKD